MATTQGIEAGKAFIRLSLNDSLFKRGLVGVRAQMQAMGRVLATVGKGLFVGGAAALGGIGVAAKSFASMGDRLNDLSKVTGVSAQGLSELKFAAEQSGASLDDVAVGMTQMNRAVHNLRTGSSSAADTFKELGISVKDLHRLNPDQQFTLMADRLSRVDDAGTRAALAMEIFGRGGRNLLPLLAEGAAGMEELRKRARDLGLTMSDEDAAAAAELDDALAALWSQLKMLAVTIGAAVAPALTDVVNFLQAVIVAARRGWEDIEFLGDVFGDTFGAIADTVSAGDIPAAVELMFASVNLIFEKNLSGILNQWKDTMDAMKRAGNDFLDKTHITGDFVANFFDSLGAGFSSGIGFSVQAFNREWQKNLAHDEKFWAWEAEDSANRNAKMDQEHAKRILEAEEKLKEAQKRFDEARSNAREATERAARERPDAAWLPDAAELGAAAAAIGGGSSSLFDARFASRVFGGGGVQEKQLRVQEKMLEELEEINDGGGIPVG